eukprot:CAMPEP_0177610798 /NCGR_PEP_ID=MMETSP0419_2-20121207/20028_1 /TAXON_ID=582737 /ORGANISM="Tetraselmis sp., Strain GSL018" /LENGTH=280 /DNA_ID=CAMNT_0019106241 /DNA_START=598 /DNA_END=1436 /DNA_ORIENTATION=-
MKNLKRARDSRRAFPLAWAVLFCVFATSDTSVILQTNNLTLDPFSDLPADFGPRIPPQGVSGLLKVAVPEDACQSLRNKPVFEPRVFVEETPHTSSDVAVVSQPWIALISRSQGHQENCTFDVKVRNAQRAGAIAAIVYDDVYEQLLIMSKPQAAEEPGIPSVFVSKKTGLILKQMMVPGVSTVHISPVQCCLRLQAPAMFLPPPPFFLSLCRCACSVLEIARCSMQGRVPPLHRPTSSPEAMRALSCNSRKTLQDAACAIAGPLLTFLAGSFDVCSFPL